MANRILTILDVKDHLETALVKDIGLVNNLDRASDRVNTGMGRVLSRLETGVGKFRGKMAMALDSVGDFVPQLGGLAPALLNPMGLAAAGVGIVAAGLVTATNKARDFEDVFMELANLNLDKSGAQIDGLKKKVLDTAFATGKSAEETSMAYFDVQSATGKYGDEVDTIVRKVADFSKATKTDFNTAIQGTVKNILNYGLATSDLDKVMKSNFATVQTGIVTFDQLAKVQVDYAGAATAANQTLDSSNKLFAVFTQKTKSVEEAATLTKSALLDFAKPETIKSFKKFGVELFDKNTGKAKQLDEVVAELNDKLKPFRGNDRAMTSIINEFKGSEGLVALIGEAAKNGDQMLKTFKAFDNVDFSFDKALANANKNAVIIGQEIRNNWNTILIELGEEILPVVNSALLSIKGNMGSIREGFRDALDIGKGFMEVVEKINLINPVRISKDFITDGLKSLFGDKPSPTVDNYSKEVRDELMSFLEPKAMQPGPFAPAMGGKLPGGKIPPGLPVNPATTKMAKDVAGVVAGGPQVRNVNVTIQKMVGIENFISNKITEATSKIREEIERALVDAVRDSEISLGNGN